MSNTVQKIQAPTTSTTGLMATPCMLAGQDHQARVTFPADGAREHTEHAEATPMSVLVTALPEFGLNSPELLYAEFAPDTNGAEISLNSQGNGQLFTADEADGFADKVIVWGQTVKTMAAAARRPATQSAPAATPTACPDGIAWCEGNPTDHADPREHRHAGPEHALTGSYVHGARGETVAAFQLTQWDDGEPHVLFQSDGTWPHLGLDQTDELIKDATAWLAMLIATRRLLAAELDKHRTDQP